MSVGAATGFLGGALRASEHGGASGSSLPIVAGFLVVLAGAAVEALTAQLFLQVMPNLARRRALALSLGGVGGALLGCVLGSTAFDAGAPWPLAGLATATLVGGVGAALGGLASLAAYHGGDYAARRIEQLSDEDW